MKKSERLRTANLLGAFALTLTDMVREQTEAAGYSAALPAAIVQIGTSPGESIDELSRTLGLSHSATVRIAERLESEGLIEKRRADDGRAVRLTLTAKGRSAMGHILQVRQDVLQSALGALNAKEIALLTGLLEKSLEKAVTSRARSDHTCRLCDQSVCPQDRCPAEPEREKLQAN